MKPTIIMLTTFVFAGVWACGGEVTPEPEDADAEICTHLINGPSLEVQTATLAAQAPEVSAAHTRHDLTLSPGTNGHSGFIKYPADEATDFIFAFNAAVTVLVFDASMTEVAPEESLSGSTECTELQTHNIYPLQVGEYVVEVRSQAGPSVGMVIEESGEEHMHP